MLSLILLTRNIYLDKLKSTLETKPTRNPLVNNKFNLKDTFKRLEKTTIKLVTIQDLQHEINSLKIEIKDLRQNQNNHEFILGQLQSYESYEDNTTDVNSPVQNNINPPVQNSNFLERQEDEDFLGLINQLKIQKIYINIRIVIKEFILKTTALFDTGADSNSILEGLIPTKYFEKTSEQLSTANVSKLKINYKLSTTTIEN